MNREFPVDEDLVIFMSKPPFQPVKYKHVKRGSVYLVISDNEYHLNDISGEGSFHPFVHQGVEVQCEFQFSGVGRYGGPIVIYVGEDGKFWMRPHFEFHDGRFVKLEN